MNPFLRVIEALNSHAVRYVIVGGLAAYLHGTRRVTVDMDIVVDLQPDEARKAIVALQSIGMQSRLPVDPLLFADIASREKWIAEKNMTVFPMFDPDEPGFAVDLFVQSPKDFEALYDASMSIQLEDLTARISSIEDLIEMKLEAGRPQDLLDVAALREVQQLAKQGSDEANRSE